MRLLIPFAAIGVVLWLASTSGWHHANQGTRIADVAIIAAAGAVLEVIVIVLTPKRKPARPASPYAATGRRR